MASLKHLHLDDSVTALFEDIEKKFQEAQHLPREKKMQNYFFIGVAIAQGITKIAQSGEYAKGTLDAQYQRGLDYLFQKYGREGGLEERPVITRVSEFENQYSS